MSTPRMESGAATLAKGCAAIGEAFGASCRDCTAIVNDAVGRGILVTSDVPSDSRLA